MTITASIQGFWKAAILACFVEKPPVEVVVKEWFIASKKSKPKNINIIVSREVKPK